ncbi:MAG: hypothetical protein DMG31_14340, partial [Acidobacteria bacterium]
MRIFCLRCNAQAVRFLAPEGFWAGKAKQSRSKRESELAGRPGEARALRRFGGSRALYDGHPDCSQPEGRSRQNHHCH